MYYKLKFYLTSLLLCLMIAGCEEKDPPVIPSPTLKNGTVTEINRFGATLSGTINYTGGATVKEFGLAYSLLSSMPLEETTRIPFTSKESGKEQKITLSQLTPATKYYYRLYANNGYNEVFSEQQHFETTADDKASFGEMVLLDVTENEVTVQCNFVDKGGTDIKEYGFAFRKKDSTEEEKQIKSENENENGVFSATISGLEHSTEYDIWAFAINSKGKGESETLTVGTSVPVAPQLNLTVKESNYNSISLSAVLQNEKEANGITEVGFYWSKDKEELATAGTQVIAKLEKGTFGIDLNDLEQNTTYYVKAYAINKTVKGESEIVSATTARSVVPVLATLTSLSVTEETIKLSGKITDYGGHKITALGYTYQTGDEKSNTGNISIEDLKEDGTFQFTVTGLKHSTKYKIMAFATNQAGNGYSEEIEVTTAVPSAPILKITATADGSKNINLKATIENSDVADGITEVGFYWSKDKEELATAGTQVVAKLDENIFATTLTGLEQNTTYYVKAYAINKTIKGESKIASATTARSVVPVLAALSSVSTTEEGITLSGKITDYGGHEITALGYTYQTGDEKNNTGDISMENLKEDGTFQFTITGLKHSTEYKIKAFAKNEAGNGYSEEIKATTAVPSAPTLKITATADGSQIINLKATIENPDVANGITEVGFYWSKDKEELATEGTHVIAKLEDNSFAASLTGLEQSTTYYVKAYAINKTIKGESEITSATTARSVVPVLSELTSLAVTEETIKLSGMITDNGGHDITALGYTYQTSDGKSNSGDISIESLNEDGTFQFTVSGLKHSTEYQVKAFATNKAGNGYSEAIKVTTAVPTTPTLMITATADGSKKINLKATIQNSDEANGITEVGFYWSKDKEKLATEGTQVIAKLEENSFTGSLTELEQNTTYYVKAYAINKTVKGESEIVSATTARSTVPSFSELKLVSATEKALVVSGSITDNGGHDITELGFMYQKPNSEDEIKNDISLDKLNTDGSFQFTIANLVPGSTYQIRAYAVNKAGTGYSAYASLSTAIQKEPTIEMQVTETTATTISVSAAVTEKGGDAATLTEVGFVYSTENEVPTLLDKKVKVEEVGENYSAVLKELKQGVTYYIRAYAKNDTKTGYSEVKSITTTRSAVPTIDKVTMGTITDVSATVTGKVLDNGNNNLTAIGFSYKTAAGNEMQVSVNLTDLSNDNTFQATLNGLNANTDYQVRAYATNKEGTGYGEYTDFKTTDLMTPKLTLVTDSIATEFVNLSAVIQSVGKEGATIKEVGFCWSTTNTLPTVSDSTKKSELKDMSFAGMLTDLKSSTTYYIRAYAVNESVMGYSNVITVKTLASNKPDIDDNPLPDLQ